jgi:predicted DsbA family dithiol-disulfide isomerase
VSAPTTPVEVDVISDVVCPWCFVGKRQLDRAIDLLRRGEPSVEVSVRWHPYLLNPDTPPEGEPYRPFLERKFGGASAVEAVWQRVRDAGAGAGVDFAFERIERRPRTIEAHRLIRRQGGVGEVVPLVEALFVAHFQNGQDIGDPQVLAAIVAATNGEPPAGVLAYLESDADRQAVLDEVEEAARIGVRSVPFFIFNQRLGFSGAQPAETLVSAMQEAMAPAE